MGELIDVYSCALTDCKELYELPSGGFLIVTQRRVDAIPATHCHLMERLDPIAAKIRKHDREKTAYLAVCYIQIIQVCGHCVPGTIQHQCSFPLLKWLNCLHVVGVSIGSRIDDFRIMEILPHREGLHHSRIIETGIAILSFVEHTQGKIIEQVKEKVFCRPVVL